MVRGSIYQSGSIHAALVAGGMLVHLCGSPAQAVLTNGSFEDPIVPTGFYTNFAGGSTLITDWTVVGVDAAIVNKTFVQNGITFQAHSGDQWLDLAGVASNSSTSGVTRNVLTILGQEYDIGFFVGSATDHSIFFPTTVDLSVDAGPRVSFTNPNAPTDHLDWMGFTSRFTATSALTNITFFNGGSSNNYLNGLDDVTFEPAGQGPGPGPGTAVPEPSSLMMGIMAMGAVVMGLVSRRRQSAL